MKMQKHLEQYEQFRTCLDGIEIQCFLSYEPGSTGWADECAYPESASVEYVLLNGTDICEWMNPNVLEVIAARYLARRNNEIEDARTEKRIEMLP
jgi:hypothetical protein